MTGPVGRALGRMLARLARDAPARVFIVEGAGAPAPPALLRLSPKIELVDSPRSATILLVAGELPAALGEAIQRVHDQIAPPRRTVVWRAAPDPTRSPADPVVPNARVLTGDAAAIARGLTQLQAGLLTGAEPSEVPLLPDVDPAPWRGVGPYGQGGTGMTGGVPYGRPIAETAPDRDGLRLDRLEVRVGPFFPPFPTGLVLTLTLQGDVVQEVSLGDNAFASVRHAMRGDPFRQALASPVLIATLELARARHHLRWLAHALHIHGLAMLGRRALLLAERVSAGEARPIAELCALLERTRALDDATAGVAVIEPDLVRGRGLGPVTRASGVAEDARADDEAYRALGFEPVTTSGGDARARWRQRLAEVEQSVTLAGRAGDAVAGGDGVVIESPRGRLTPETTPLDGLLALVRQLLTGCEWGDAVTAIVSLDLDLREVAPRPVAADDRARG